MSLYRHSSLHLLPLCTRQQVPTVHILPPTRHGISLYILLMLYTYNLWARINLYVLTHAHSPQLGSDFWPIPSLIKCGIPCPPYPSNITPKMPLSYG